MISTGATGCHTELYDCHVERGAETSGEQDHNMRNQMLKLLMEHHTRTFIQSCLPGQELGRAAIGCRCAADCLWEMVAVCGPQEARVSMPSEQRGLNWWSTPFNLASTRQNVPYDCYEVEAPF